MTYPLLEQAPQDHHSEEFLQFLRDNNPVVWENGQWLVIENCKYHTPDRTWLTAFHKLDHPHQGYNLDILAFKFDHLDLLVKAPTRRSVQRFHVHLTALFPSCG